MSRRDGIRWFCVLAALMAWGCAPGGGGDGGGGGSGGGSGEPLVDGGLPGGEGCSTSYTEGDVAIADSCTGNQICICPSDGLCPEGGGRCEDAFGRRYELIIGLAGYPERKPNGDCWDAGCGAPDPYVNVWVDGEFVGGTPTRRDTFNPEWGVEDGGELGRVTMLAGSEVRIEANDEDLAANDPGLHCDSEVTAQLLRARLILCITADETFWVAGAIQP